MPPPTFPDHRLHCDSIARAITRACDPRSLTANFLRSISVAPSHFGAAVGKAALPMAAGFANAIAPLDGPIVTPHADLPPSDPRIISAGHPLPDEGSQRAGAAIAQHLAHRCASPLMFLLSGGASSLMVDLPPEIPLDDYRRVVLALLRSGASIHELNTVRKHIDLAKGGWLARRAAATSVLLLVFSDVAGDDLSTIGSGPFAPDPTTYADALAVLVARNCLDASPSVTRWLRDGIAGLYPETPKPGDPAFDRVQSHILASNATAVAAAVVAAEHLGFRVAEQRLGVIGEAAEVGRSLARSAKQLAATHQPGSVPVCLVWGGETTVTVGTAQGLGGRNQELALAAAVELDGSDRIAVMAFATDGTDGPTDAAGGVVSGGTVTEGQKAGLDAPEHLARHDSHPYLDRLGCLIRTGPTGTNVNDVAIALVY